MHDPSQIEEWPSLSGWLLQQLLRDVLVEFQEMLEKPDFNEFLNQEAVHMIQQGMFEPKQQLLTH